MENRELENLVDPLEFDDFQGIMDEDYLRRWNKAVENAEMEDWDEDDQADAESISAMAVFTEDGWQKHFMRRMISDIGGLEIDWQNPEISKFKAEVECKPAVSELIDRELEWQKENPF